MILQTSAPQIPLPQIPDEPTVLWIVAFCCFGGLLVTVLGVRLLGKLVTMVRANGFQSHDRQVLGHLDRVASALERDSTQALAHHKAEEARLGQLVVLNEQILDETRGNRAEIRRLCRPEGEDHDRPTPP